MSTDENKAVVRQLYEALNQGLVTVLDDHSGLAADTASLRHAYALAPNMQATIEELIAEGEWVAARLTLAGTLTSPGVGDGAPPGTPISYELLALYRIVAGQIVQQYSQADALALQQQLGRSADAGS